MGSAEKKIIKTHTKYGEHYMDDFQKVRFFLASIKKNREELYCAMMLVYLCGLQKKEIVSIKIEDITDQNNCYFDQYR